MIFNSDDIRYIARGAKKGHPREVPFDVMVSDTRIELVTSSVSGKRSSSELITHAAVAT